MNQIKTGIFVISLILVFASCRQHKELVYMQGIDLEDSLSLKAEVPYLLQEHDILYVKIITMNEKMQQLFDIYGSSRNNNLNRQYNESMLYFEGYSIDANGNITLPVLGDINVIGLTTENARIRILEEAKKYIKDPIVTVRFANNRITVFGEVSKPGIYSFYSNQITLLQAISTAGDLTDYANRRRILLLRPETNGLSSHRINLTSKDFVNSEFYFLKPNDIIYIEPSKSKSVRLIASDYGIFLTSITSTITALLLILNL